MDPTDGEVIRQRVRERIGAWRVDVERVVETESSVLAFGRRGKQPVVLKVIRHRVDEWRSGEVLRAFDGAGVVRALDHVDGAVLLEWLRPGEPLAGLSMEGRDEQATEALADVIGRMSPRDPPGSTSTVQEWARGFEQYAASGDTRIPRPLLAAARDVYSGLSASQSRPRLLHGDLHHDNVLLDADRGWLAIDPKGVIGEPEYEIGAALRNPYELPGLFTDPATIRRRVEQFERVLGLDGDRILGWAFSQAVLAVAWAVEDGLAVGPDHPCLTLARRCQALSLIT